MDLINFQFNQHLKDKTGAFKFLESRVHQAQYSRNCIAHFVHCIKPKITLYIPRLTFCTLQALFWAPSPVICTCTYQKGVFYSWMVQWYERGIFKFSLQSTVKCIICRWECPGAGCLCRSRIAARCMRLHGIDLWNILLPWVVGSL